MKTRLRLFSVTVIAFFTIAISSYAQLQRVSSKTFDITSFNAIKADAVCEIYLKQSDHVTVKAEGINDDLQGLIVCVKNNELIIEQKNKKHKNLLKKRLRKTNIYITTPTLSKLTTNGVEDISNYGVGKITYYGNPRVKHMENKGVGKIKSED